jgi:radical SAM superfamily enzyme YgiQ (UPF0313 family)
LYSLKAYAGEALAKHVEIAEYTINQTKESILMDIYRQEPDAVGFSCYIWNMDRILELASDLAQIRPDMPIWLGGPEVSYEGDQLLKQYPFLTGIITGEGEIAFRNLLDTYLRLRGENSEISTVIRDTRGETPTASLDARGETPTKSLDRGVIKGTCISKLQDIPFFYGEQGIINRFQNKIIYYESSRGCPFHCSYCLSGAAGELHFRDTDVVKKELAFFLSQKIKQVKFVDRTFNAKKSHTLEIWRFLLEHDNGITNFHFEIAGDLLDEEEIALLGKMRPGLIQLEIGVQSVNPQTLKAINRITDLEVLRNNCMKIGQSHNVHQHLDLIAGLPYEDYLSFGRSFDWVYGLHPQQLQLGFLKLLKGSPLARTARSLGLVYSKQPPYEILSTPYISFKELMRLKRIEQVVEIYYNSSQFTHSLEFLESCFPRPFSLFEAMGDYFQEDGLLYEGSSRETRYEALLSFCRHICPAAEERFKELLLYDIYVRENCKSRPKFAPSQDEHKEEMKIIYQREAQEHKYLLGYDVIPSRQLQRMTHMEYFHYPIEQSFPTPGFILFDYENRDPLTHNARAIPIDEL